MLVIGTGGTSSKVKVLIMHCQTDTCRYVQVRFNPSRAWNSEAFLALLEAEPYLLPTGLATVYLSARARCAFWWYSGTQIILQHDERHVALGSEPLPRWFKCMLVVFQRCNW